jgi:hypothetical protein
VSGRKHVDLDVEALRARWEGGEMLAALAAEVSVSRPTLWRRIGRPDAPPVDFVTRSAFGTIVPEPDVAFVAWAAGFFDGEGCIHAGFETAPKYGLRTHLMVVVGQTVPGPLVAIQSRWGGSLRDQPARNPRHQHQWHWRLIGKNAAPFLTDVLPYLRVKRRAALLALDYIALIHPHSVRLTEEDHARRRPIVEALQALNAGTPAAREARRVRAILRAQRTTIRKEA